MTMISATYSPEDDKLRLYASARLDRETYERVRAKGFRYAPHQELFFAAWTPYAEELALELAGEIDDEDKSLRERAEERSERFEEYSDSRNKDADAASAVVHRIADMTQGQPILIGHHSEKRHRRDLSRMDAKMSEAVQMWRTSQYWTQRAASAIAHAKYKERPDVRARRIKGLESDLRKHTDNCEKYRLILSAWQNLGDEPDHDKALALANLPGMGFNSYMDLKENKRTPAEVRASVLASFTRYIDIDNRWKEHTANRLEYERAMLAASGGIETDKSKPEVGGGVVCWASPGRFKSTRGYSWVKKVNKVSVTVEDNWNNGNQENFTRTIPFDKCTAVISKADVEQARAEGRLCENDTRTGFYVTAAPPPTEEAQ